MTLTFGQAQEKARAWFAQLEQAGGRAAPPLTVKDCTEHYVADYRARGGKGLKAAQAAIDAHILPGLGKALVSDLTTLQVRAWLRQVAEAPARLRSKASAEKQAVRVTEMDDDARRARRATANRVLTTLKAALNLAYRDQRVPSDAAWRRVKPFPSVDAPRVRYLTDGEAARLVNACPIDLRALVTAALLTGCRYGELAALRPKDVELEARVLHIPTSKSGKARVVILTDEATGFFDSWVAGKDRKAPLFSQQAGGPWGKSHQFRPLRAASAAARIDPAVNFHILRHTHASRLAMQGVPMQVIAEQLGHADQRVTAKHYAHLSPGYVADTIRAAFKPLGIAQPNSVTPIRKTG